MDSGSGGLLNIWIKPDGSRSKRCWRLKRQLNTWTWTMYSMAESRILMGI